MRSFVPQGFLDRSQEARCCVLRACDHARSILDQHDGLLFCDPAVAKQGVEVFQGNDGWRNPRRVGVRGTGIDECGSLPSTNGCDANPGKNHEPRSLLLVEKFDVQVNKPHSEACVGKWLSAKFFKIFDQACGH